MYSKFLIVLLTLTSLLMSACDNTNATSSTTVSELPEMSISTLSKNTNELSEFVNSSVKDLNYVNKVREFVNNNTWHSGFWTICDQESCLEDLIQATIDYINTGDNPPEVFCSHRAILMRAILESEGIPTRFINIRNDLDEGHVYLEVFINGIWHIQDPDYNVYFKHILTGDYLSSEQLKWLPPSIYKPCSNKGCGWNLIHSKDVYEPNMLVHRRFIPIIDLRYEM